MSRLVDIRSAAATKRRADERASHLELWGVIDEGQMSLAPWKGADEAEFYRHMCVERFYAFFMHAWGVLHGPHARDWWIDRAEVAEPLAEWLDYQAREWLASRARHEKVIRHIAVIVTREFGKTTMMQAWNLWLHLQDQNLSTYFGGEKETLAADALSTIRAVLTGGDKHAKFVEMYGDWIGSEGVVRRDSIIHTQRTTTTRRDPSFGIWGVESGLTGRHPDVANLDDPNTYERAAAQGNWYQLVADHCASLAPVIRTDGMFALWGTPYSEADHLNKTLRRDGIASLTGIPMAEFEPRKDGVWHVFHFPGRDLAGRATVPNVWSEERMKKYERESPDRYAAQILLRPELSEHNPLTIEQIRDCFCDEKNVPMNLLRFSLHMDTAFKSEESKHRGDESVFEVWGHWRDGSGDVVFVEGYGSNIWRGEDFYSAVVRTLQRYRRTGRKIAVITDEASPGKTGAGRMVLESFCHGAGIQRPGEYLELPRGGKKKLEQRIIPAASYWADGHVKLLRTAPGLDNLVKQMSRIRTTDHDDWADAAADVFHPLVYHRQRKLGAEANETPPWLATPQDVILKGSSNPDELRRMYDAYTKRDEVDFEPV